MKVSTLAAIALVLPLVHACSQKPFHTESKSLSRACAVAAAATAGDDADIAKLQRD